MSARSRTPISWSTADPHALRPERGRGHGVGDRHDPLPSAKRPAAAVAGRRCRPAHPRLDRRGPGDRHALRPELHRRRRDGPRPDGVQRGAPLRLPRRGAAVPVGSINRVAVDPDSAHRLRHRGQPTRAPGHTCLRARRAAASPRRRCAARHGARPRRGTRSTSATWPTAMWRCSTLTAAGPPGWLHCARPHGGRSRPAGMSLNLQSRPLFLVNQRVRSSRWTRHAAMPTPRRDAPPAFCRARWGGPTHDRDRGTRCTSVTSGRCPGPRCT